MPPKRNRLVVDERQQPAVASSSANPCSAVVGGKVSGVTTAVSGVVAIDDAAVMEAAARRPLWPAGVLDRLPATVRRMYQQQLPTEENAPCTEGLNNKSNNNGNSGSDINNSDGGRKKEEREFAVDSIEALPASPTGSALEEDVMRQIALRKKNEETKPPSAKPLYLSNRWSRLRIGAVRPGEKSDVDEGEGSDQEGERSSSSSTPHSANTSHAEEEEQDNKDGMLRFGDATNGKKRKNAFGDDHISFGGGASLNSSDEDDASAASSSASSSRSSMDAERDLEGVYNDCEEGGDVLVNDLGPMESISAEKRRMLEQDPAVEKRIRATRMAHIKREREREARLRRQFSRHMSGYDDESLRAQEQALLCSQSESESDLGSDDDAEEEGSTSEGGEEEPAAARARNESGGGFGARARFESARQSHRQGDGNQGDADEDAEGEKGSDGFAFPESSPLSHRQQFGSIFFETHLDRTATDAKGGVYPCHHTLLCLRGPITIQGPCGLIGFGIGEASVGGFLLGRKQIVLGNKEERVVLMPMKKLKTKTSELMELPNLTAERRAILAKSLATSSVPALDPLHAASEMSLFTSCIRGDGREGTTANTGCLEEEEDATAGDMHDVEAVFGRIDWDWVQVTIKAWRELFKDKLPTMLLVVQPFNAGTTRGELFHHPMRKHYLHSAKAKRRMRRRKLLEEQLNKGRRKGDAPALLAVSLDDGKDWLQRATEEEVQRAERRGVAGLEDGDDGGDASRRRWPESPKGGAYVEIPSFISRQSQQNIDLALLPDIIPNAARVVGSSPTGGAAVVLGSQDVGKSTLCRFLANTFFSQHGLCFWLDLDLGQPEFGVPGQFGLYCIQRPLLRPRDVAAATLVKSVFVGSPTASSPQAVAAALANICAFVTATVSRRHPVVVNTHGWVLHTGRRVTVEAIQRLLPKIVIHLVKEREEAWASDTSVLMNPAAGLNAEVVGRRFLVRDVTTSEKREQNEEMTKRPGKRGKHSKSPAEIARSEKNSSNATLFSRLPHSVTSASSCDVHHPTAAGWSGTVHTVRVNREADALKLRLQRKKTKGAFGRQLLWQTYLYPLLAHYEDQKGSFAAEEHAVATATPPLATLLKAPLHCLRSVVLANADERLNTDDAAVLVPLVELAATLEHRVVAVQIHCGPQERTPTSWPRVLSLDGLPSGFEASCFGYVESTERQMLPIGEPGAGTIAIRLPLPRKEMTTLLSAGDWSLSLAVSPSTMHDTHFMEFYP